MKKEITILSLFDGMSCGQIAIDKLGINNYKYYASEIDKYAIKVTQANYPNTIQIGDITKVSYKEGVLYTENGKYDVGKIDLLIGGSPCQGFSISGKGLNFEDPRSKLFFEFSRLLNEVNPKYFLLENVRMKLEWRDIISKYVGVEPIKINSSLVSAQNRRRLYWTNIPNVTLPNDEKINIRDILEKTDIDERYYLSKKAINRIKNSTFGREFANVNTPKTGTLIAGYYKIPSDGIYYNDNGRKRRYTPVECEKLQTVPINYTNHVSNTQRYKMLGNGFTVDVIKHILSFADWNV